MVHEAEPGGTGPAAEDDAEVAGLRWLQRLADEHALERGEPAHQARPAGPGEQPAEREPGPGPADAAGRPEPDGGLGSPPGGQPDEGGVAAGVDVTPGEMPVPTTGEPRVDAALKLLDRLPGLPVSDHPELFEQVHARLSEVLGELESGPAGPAGR
jgi:hypothetical protein